MANIASSQSPRRRPGLRLWTVTRKDRWWSVVAELLDRITARIAELTTQQETIRQRAIRDMAAVQVQIDALRDAQVLMTPEVETALSRLLALKLIPKE